MADTVSALIPVWMNCSSALDPHHAERAIVGAGDLTGRLDDAGRQTGERQIADDRAIDGLQMAQPLLGADLTVRFGLG